MVSVGTGMKKTCICRLLMHVFPRAARQVLIPRESKAPFIDGQG